MAEESGEGHAGETSLHRRVLFWLFAALLILAGVFWVWWGFTFGVWLDNGVYAVVVTLALFGLSGMWLVAPDPVRPPAPIAPKT